MSASEKPAEKLIRRRVAERGATVVEFALILICFLMFIFGVLELARLMFLYNTLQDATRHAAKAAAISDFRNAATMDAIRQEAIFRSTPGGLVLMKELTDKAIRIDFLSVSRAGDGTLGLQEVSSGELASSPAENEANCRTDPYASNCIRFVRARVCDPKNATGCVPVKFTTLTTIINFTANLPVATTITHVQSMGHKPN